MSLAEDAEHRLHDVLGSPEGVRLAALAIFEKLAHEPVLIGKESHGVFGSVHWQDIGQERRTQRPDAAPVRS